MISRKPAHGPVDQGAQALGEVGAREELDRLGIVAAGVLGPDDAVRAGVARALGDLVGVRTP